MNQLTVRQIRKAGQRHRYLALMEISGNIQYINTYVMFYGKNSRKGIEDKKTKFISYKSCNINEYISGKRPFMSNKN